MLLFLYLRDVFSAFVNIFRAAMPTPADILLKAVRNASTVKLPKPAGTSGIQYDSLSSKPLAGSVTRSASPMILQFFLRTALSWKLQDKPGMALILRHRSQSQKKIDERLHFSNGDQRT